MKKNLLFLLAFLFFCCTKNQKKENNANFNKINIDKAILISENSNLNRNALKYNDIAYNALKNRENSKKNRERIIKIAKQYYKLFETSKLKEACKTSLKMSLDANDSISLGRTYNFLGKYKSDINEIDSAFFYFKKSERFLLKKNDTIYLWENYLNTAFIELQINDFSGCESSAIKSLSYNIKKENPLKIYEAYNLIGICSNEVKNYENALIYHNKAIKILEENDVNNKSQHLSRSLNNIGVVYQNLNNHKKAIDFFKNGLKSKKLLEEAPDIYAMLMDNYAYSKFKLNELNELPGLFLISLNQRNKNKLNQGIILSKLHLSEYYFYVNDIERAKKYALEALSFSKKTKIINDILPLLKHLSEVDEINSIVYSKEYIRLSDSVQNEERKAKDRFARIAYETDEVIQKNSELEVKNRNLVIFLFGAVAIFFLLYAVRTQKMRNRELAFKQEQLETNNQIYNIMISQQEKVNAASAFEKNRMAQELHDGILSKMFGTRMNLDSLNDSKDEASITMRYNYIQELKKVEQEIREISHDLSNENVKLINNFVPIVTDLLNNQQKTFVPELTYTINKSIPWSHVDNTAKINLYRIIQESLQNINKYAKAKTITVSLTHDNIWLVLTIIDDGVGFDVRRKKNGIGLKNMLSRALESKGTYEITSEKNIKTITNVKLPIKQKT